MGKFSLQTCVNTKKEPLPRLIIWPEDYISEFQKKATAAIVNLTLDCAFLVHRSRQQSLGTNLKFCFIFRFLNVGGASVFLINGLGLLQQNVIDRQQFPITRFVHIFLNMLNCGNPIKVKIVYFAVFTLQLHCAGTLRFCIKK